MADDQDRLRKIETCVTTMQVDQSRDREDQKRDRESVLKMITKLDKIVLGDGSDDNVGLKTKVDRLNEWAGRLKSQVRTIWGAFAAAFVAAIVAAVSSLFPPKH